MQILIVCSYIVRRLLNPQRGYIVHELLYVLQFGNLAVNTHHIQGGINHDPDIYEDPETFNPDRYLQSEYGTKPGVDDTDFRHTLIFGAGRVSESNLIYRKLILLIYPDHSASVQGCN